MVTSDLTFSVEFIVEFIVEQYLLQFFEYPYMGPSVRFVQSLTLAHHYPA